ncbi:hypothetical protein ACLOJK_041865 [Asimina triloba]
MGEKLPGCVVLLNGVECPHFIGMKSSHALHVVVASHAMHACCPPRLFASPPSSPIPLPASRWIFGAAMAAPRRRPDLDEGWVLVADHLGRPEPESVARRPSDCAATLVKVGLGTETKKMGFRFGDALPPASRLPVAASFVRLVAGRHWLPVAVAQLASVCRMEETLAGSHGWRPWGDDGALV